FAKQCADFGFARRRYAMPGLVELAELCRRFGHAVPEADRRGKATVNEAAGQRDGMPYADHLRVFRRTLPRGATEGKPMDIQNPVPFYGGGSEGRDRYRYQ